MLPVCKRRFKTRANCIVLFLQAISPLTAEADFVAGRFPAQSTKRFSLGEPRSFFADPIS